MEADPPAGVTTLQNGPRKVSGRAAPGAAGPDPGVSTVSALCTAGRRIVNCAVALYAVKIVKPDGRSGASTVAQIDRASTRTRRGACRNLDTLKHYAGYATG